MRSKVNACWHNRRIQMTPILNALNDLSYVVECAALDYMGEGKTELENLCNDLETNPQYAFEGREQFVIQLRETLACYKADDKASGAMRLMSVSRSLWEIAKKTPT